jgi:hypothetical protein
MADTSRRGLLLTMIDVDHAFEDEFNRCYREEHFPERIACPGFLNGRHFTAIEGAPKYLAVYDLETPAVLESEPYKKIYAPSPWTRRIAQHFLRLMRNVYTEISLTGAETANSAKSLLLVMVDVAPDHEEELKRWYDQQHIPERMAIPGIVRARGFVALKGRPKYLALYDLESASVLKSKEYRYRLNQGATEWTRRIQPMFDPMVRNVYVELVSPEDAPR